MLMDQLVQFIVVLAPLCVAAFLVAATHRTQQRAHRAQRKKRRRMGAAAPTAAAAPSLPETRVDAETAAEIRALMAAAKEKLAAGDGDGAIACALAAAKLGSGGDEAAMKASLDAAKHTASAQRRRERDIRPDLTDEEAAELAAARGVCDDLLDRSSIVGDERGKRDLLQDAFQDGSSVVCVRCGDLVARSRWDAHLSRWCRALPDSDSDGDGDD